MQPAGGQAQQSQAQNTQRETCAWLLLPSLDMHRDYKTPPTATRTYRHVGPWVAPHVALHGLFEQLSTANVGNEQGVCQASGLEAGVHCTIIVAHKDGLLDLLLLQV